MDKPVLGQMVTCARCGKLEPLVTPHEEMLAEVQQYWGKNIPLSELAIVCDDCWNFMHPEKHPHMVEEDVAEYLRKEP